MISVQQAHQIIRDNVPQLAAETVELDKALHRVLVEDLISPIDLPSFHQSAMDGYAFAYRDVARNNGSELTVAGEVPAGSHWHEEIKSGQAARIFTGAPLPKGADTVIMQEKVVTENGAIHPNDPQLTQGANVRQQGEQIAKGDVALTKGTRLNAGAIGFLAAMGIKQVSVARQPKVAILVTGSELQTPGQPLATGQVYESNSAMIASALQAVGIENVKIMRTGDTQQATNEAVEELLADVDVLITTGGISVGDYDLVNKALEKADVQELFSKIAQKPGKPIYFGTRDRSAVFGLPGNPGAALSCFYEYVYPGVNAMQQVEAPQLKTLRRAVDEAISKKSGRALFLKAKLTETGVKPLKGQNSFILSSFVEADGLICLPEEAEYVEQGDDVEVHLLPNG